MIQEIMLQSMREDRLTLIFNVQRQLILKETWFQMKFKKDNDLSNINYCLNLSNYRLNNDQFLE